MTLFSFHTGHRALIVHDPETGKAQFGIQVEGLKAAGWDVNEGDLRRALPRADASQIVQASAGALRALDAGRHRR